MRPRFRQLMPIVAIALLVQLLSPIGAFRVVALSVSDPLAVISICSGRAGTQDSSGLPAGPHGDGSCCAICAAGLGGPPVPNGAPFSFVTLQRQYQTVVWRERIAAPTADRVGSNAQARGPPLAALL
ncbi:MULTISPECIES: DUF2946 family protein [Rhodopseudomonas]|uniref:DUF2946 domain-containing protein n=1 Tax=Rhodopseudomonas palustris TaxID=1076 RepID=A0A0D7ECS3_RHOPL|nr:MULTISPECIES: DUF2946 family protein [Rhodopseudomonas]KIZ37362.1 hypothetical protein OO17_23715 [Rhodopseudomonas palustris]MDF3812696.1 DUF2946 family protein [Rhodopseudomonas sp. BAL398]WOK18958.1 DUF2946 family protein [Rhodopseudomonas sp. BAL398]